jgi:hypothetical protein
MALSFVDQDLCNRSFEGRQDLAGADFTGADLRGCDFRGAVLVGANCTRAKTGKSRRQLMILIAVAGAVVVYLMWKDEQSHWDVVMIAKKLKVINNN